jgi:hypothetical protein
MTENDEIHPFTKLIVNALLGNDEDIKKLASSMKSFVSKDNIVSLKKAKVTKVTKVRKADSEYVYDIGMKNTKHPWFFANNMLIHNSVYFSAYPILKDQIEAGEIEWTKESIVKFYDKVSDMINDTYPDFMLDTFNVPKSRSTGVIASGREIVAESGLYIKKKRYAALVYDNEGERKDVNGSPGKIKAMGLDLRRADTPKFVQDFLTELLKKVLLGDKEDDCVEYIREFKEKFDNLHPWEKGTPKAVNGVTKYMNRIAERNKSVKLGVKPPTITIPGHVQGSFNWNLIRDRYNDLHRVKIVDGSKVIVCYLKQNDDKFKSIAYPVDEPHLPEWFTNMPFDEEIMMEKVVDQKVRNMIGVLKWDLSKTDKQEQHFGSMFSFD